MEQQIQDLKQQLDQQLLVNQQQLLDAQQQQQVAQEQLQNAQQNSFHQGYRKRKAEEVAIKEDLLTKEFTRLRMEFRAQGAANNIRSFSGEGSEKFLTWLKDMERVLTQLQAEGDDSRAHALALQTLNGPAADFVTRLLQEDPHMTWATLKEKLGERYSDMADLAYARQKLRRLLQAKGESVQDFHERLLTAAQNVYGSEKMNLDYIQDQLIEYFIDGLQEDMMAKRLIRLRPKTMEDALKSATAEQQAQKTFELRRGSTREEVPMEVDGLTTTQPQQNEMAKMTALLQEVLSHLKRPVPNNYVPNNSQNNLPPRDQRGRFTDNRATSNIRCYNCHRQGHIASQCRSRVVYNNRPQRPNMPQQGNGWRPTYAEAAARPPNNQYRGQSGNM